MVARETVSGVLSTPCHKEAKPTAWEVENLIFKGAFSELNLKFTAWLWFCFVFLFCCSSEYFYPPLTTALPSIRTKRREEHLTVKCGVTEDRRKLFFLLGLFLCYLTIENLAMDGF